MGNHIIRCKDDNAQIKLHFMQSIYSINEFIDAHNHNKDLKIENLEIMWG